MRWACNSSIAGYVANNPSGGSFGLNVEMIPGEDDLYVEFFDSNLMVMVRGHMVHRGSIAR